MTLDTPNAPDAQITTPTDFETALETLIHTALKNGFDPTGAWEYHNGDTDPDLEIIVTQLAD